MTDPLTNQLEESGIAILPDLVTTSQLQGMRVSFNTRLKRMRWNNCDGYEKTDGYRHMVQDVLTLDQGFIDAALHPIVISALREYLGDTFELVEAKGWKSLPTSRDFNTWHGDAWYDQERVKGQIPGEVKLGLYLTDVRSGGFVYVKGTHRKQHPRPLTPKEARALSSDLFVEVTGPAGLAFLFDTSGFHRQNVPILEPREAVFFAYHDPKIPLQREDLEYYRYHPLQLNAAFLGNLTDEDRRILGFGNTTNFQPAYERRSTHDYFQRLISQSYDAKVFWGEFYQRATAKLNRLTRIGRKSE
jgi:Phytanoyl-CoA dioxygenase (PhyH)